VVKRRSHSQNQHRKSGDVLAYISPWDTLQPGDRVVIVSRVSGREQNRRGNLYGSDAWLRFHLKRKRAKIVGCIRRAGSGFDPIWLKKTARRAKKRRAKMVAVFTDRFIRHRDFNSRESPDLQAGAAELKKLQDCTFGICLVTWAPPNASPKLVRRLRSKIGQWFRNNCGGRPEKTAPGAKKERRERDYPVAKVCFEHGLSVRRIGRFLDIPHMTIQNWRKRWLNEKSARARRSTRA